MHGFLAVNTGAFEIAKVTQGALELRRVLALPLSQGIKPVM